MIFDIVILVPTCIIFILTVYAAVNSLTKTNSESENETCNIELNNDGLTQEKLSTIQCYVTDNYDGTYLIELEISDSFIKNFQYSEFGSNPEINPYHNWMSEKQCLDYIVNKYCKLNNCFPDGEINFYLSPGYGTHTVVFKILESKFEIKHFTHIYCIESEESNGK